MKSGTFAVSVIICLFTVSAFGKTQFPEIYCPSIAVNKLKYSVTAGPTSDGDKGIIDYSIYDDGSSTTATGAGNKPISVHAIQTAQGLKYTYVTDGVSVETDPSSCTVKPNSVETSKCQATFKIGNDGGKAECAAYFALTLSESIEAALKHFPDVEAARKAVSAADAARGGLWERFVPQFAASATHSHTVTNSNYPELAGTIPTYEAYSVQTVLPLSAATFFAWNASDIALNASQTQDAIVENKIALKVISYYTAIYENRRLLQILRDGFIHTLEKMKEDPKVKANPQLLNMVGNLLYGIRSAAIALKYNIAVSADQFEHLTGIHLALENAESNSLPEATSDMTVHLSALFSATLPLFPDLKTVRELVKEKSPLIKSAYFSTAAAKNAYNLSKWGFAQASVSYGPTWTTAPLPAPLAPYSSRATGLAVTGGVSFDPFGYFRNKRAAKKNFEAAEATRDGGETAVETASDADFYQYLQQVETVCTLKPQLIQILEQFSSLAEAIQSGKPYDLVAAASNFPQALQVVQQLFGAQVTAVAAVSDIHAQMGDLNAPGSWDITGNPQQTCPSSLPK